LETVRAVGNKKKKKARVEAERRGEKGEVDRGRTCDLEQEPKREGMTKETVQAEVGKGIPGEKGKKVGSLSV